MYEYLAQHHTIDKDGKYYAEFKDRMNDQCVVKPLIEDDGVRVPHYVYFKASRSPFTLRKKNEESSADSDDSEEWEPMEKKKRVHANISDDSE
jgi:hypothetical protein